MSLSNPRRRLLQSATSLLPQSRFHPLLPCPQLHQRRTAMRDFLKNPFKSRKRRPIVDPSSPDLLKAIEAQKANEKAQQEKERSQIPKAGRIAPGTSIFDVPPPKDAAPDQPYEEEGIIGEEEEGTIRDPYNMAAALDPAPQATARWRRKMTIREVRNGGRMSLKTKLARTERSHLCKSEFFKTSVKKLFPLANQIRGKPLREAMVQMRFSKKKAAQDVLRHLEYARDEAVVVKGMELGKVRAENQEEGQESEQQERLVVEDKKGKKRLVTDRTAMYVDEAWVGRGQYGYGFDYRARGNVNRLRLPYTSISVLLKEEATRIRQAEEREAKRQRKKVWVPLPDRPITAQRQYPLW